jgi:hypothetical protein
MYRRSSGRDRHKCLFMRIPGMACRKAKPHEAFRPCAAGAAFQAAFSAFKPGRRLPLWVSGKLPQTLTEIVHVRHVKKTSAD